jgi:hypothetical protein
MNPVPAKLKFAVATSKVNVNEGTTDYKCLRLVKYVIVLGVFAPGISFLYR